MGRKSLKIVWPIVVLSIFFSLSAYALTGNELFWEMRERFKQINDYQCTYVSFVVKGNKSEEYTFRYFFKKPKKIRMEVISQKDKGTILIYRGGQVRVKPGKGLFSHFTFTFHPRHKRVCDLRGYGIDQSDWGEFIDYHEPYLKGNSFRIVGKEMVGERETILLEMRSKDPQETRGIAHEKIWVDKELKVPLKYEHYDVNNKLIRSSTYKDIKINVGLEENLFKM